MASRSNTKCPAVSIDSLAIAKIQKCGCDHVRLAWVQFSVDGIFISAELRHDGELVLPRGVNLHPAVAEMAGAYAQQAALNALIEIWAKRRPAQGVAA